MLPRQGARVLSLVEELKSCMLYGVAKKKDAVESRLEKGLRQGQRRKEVSYHLPYNTTSTQSIVQEQRRLGRAEGTEVRRP